MLNILNLAKYFSILIIALGSTFLLYFIVSYFVNETVTGEIIDFKKSSSIDNSPGRSGYGYRQSFFHPVIKFTYNAKEYQATATNGFAFGKYVRGEQLTVIFNPEKPEKVTVINLFQQLFLPFCVIIIGGIFLAAIIFFKKVFGI